MKGDFKLGFSGCEGGTLALGPSDDPDSDPWGVWFGSLTSRSAFPQSGRQTPVVELSAGHEPSSPARLPPGSGSQDISGLSHSCPRFPLIRALALSIIDPP